MLEVCEWLNCSLRAVELRLCIRLASAVKLLTVGVLLLFDICGSMVRSETNNTRMSLFVCRPMRLNTSLTSSISQAQYLKDPVSHGSSISRSSISRTQYLTDPQYLTTVSHDTPVSHASSISTCLTRISRRTET